MDFAPVEVSTGMHPAATASKILRLVELSPLGQKQNLYWKRGGNHVEGNGKEARCFRGGGGGVGGVL